MRGRRWADLKGPPLREHTRSGHRNTVAAANLHGQMLLIHGTMDDNVHMQNSVQFAYALQKAGKPFQMMIYAKSRHGFDDEQLVRHRQQLMFDFVMQTLTSSGTDAR